MCMTNVGGGLPAPFNQMGWFGHLAVQNLPAEAKDQLTGAAKGNVNAAPSGSLSPTMTVASKSLDRMAGAMAAPQSSTVLTGGTGLTIPAETDRKTLLGR